VNIRLFGYWASTAILAFAWLTGGVADLAHVPATVEGVVQLGYPPYFVTILGFWKVLGAIALLAPGFPRLKEWAYAGTFFELTGAVASHWVSGSGAWHLIGPGFFAVCAIASWVLRPQSRTLGDPFPARTWWPTSRPGAAVSPAK
jgi:uncharacterized membrane protein YphA (DoxX/SURF4 family)